MPDLLKVAKFGGTSMGDFKAMQRCAEIIQSDPDKKVIVVSAVSGTTNLLTQLFTAGSRTEKKRILEQISQKQHAIVDKLSDDSVTTQVNEWLDELAEVVMETESFTLRQFDYILSFGERISSFIFANLLNSQTGDAVWLDARDVIKTDDLFGSAEPDPKKITDHAEEKLLPVLKNSRIVTQGFIGSTDDDITTTLGRGGSDYSAALFAEAVNADVLEIWTDVEAIYTTDPRIVPDARPITEISFDEAAELSVFGAKVLHPATLKPAIRKSIRVFVGSSIHPERNGTWIVRTTSNTPVIRAITLRHNQTLLTLHSLDMLHRFGFLAQIFEILARYKISVDLVTTSEVSVSLTLDTDVQSDNKYRISQQVIDELNAFCDVQVEKDLALIALVGNNLHATAGLSGPVFSELQNINIRMICHGASSHNLCFLVDEDKAEDVVKKLHKKFITDTN